MSQICESERSNDDRSVTRNQISLLQARSLRCYLGFRMFFLIPDEIRCFFLVSRWNPVLFFLVSRWNPTFGFKSFLMGKMWTLHGHGTAILKQTGHWSDVNFAFAIFWFPDEIRRFLLVSRWNPMFGFNNSPGLHGGFLQGMYTCQVSSWNFTKKVWACLGSAWVELFAYNRA